MAVLRPETRPDGPSLTGSSVSQPDPAKLTLPGPVRPTFGHFRCRPTTPSGCKSVHLTTGLRPDGRDGLPGTVAGPLPEPLAGLVAWCNPRPGNWHYKVGALNRKRFQENPDNGQKMVFGPPGEHGQQMVF